MNRFLAIFVLSLILNLCTVLKAQEVPRNYLKGKFYNSVKNHLLIATNKIKGNKFSKSVVVMLKSDENGAWGLVVNKRLGNVPMGLLINDSWNLSGEVKKLLDKNISIFWGGPVESEKVFILHSNDYKNKTTKNYGNIAVSYDYKILFDIAKKKGPEKSLIIFGYSGWGPGQLEGEMERDRWILSDINKNIIIEKHSSKKWQKANKEGFVKI